jgi:uroporphyrinogen-III decarboxylase
MAMPTARSSTETMTNRQRILAAIDGEELDRFPVWLKMDNPTWRSSQPADVRAMDGAALLRAAGCDLMLGVGCRVRPERARVTHTNEVSDGVRVETWSTPDGDLVAESHLDPYTNSWHPVKYPVSTAEDLRRLRWVHEDVTWTFDEQEAAQAAARKQELVAMDAFTMGGIGPGPLMNLVEHYCGPENAVFLMCDEPELFEQTLETMHVDRMAQLRALLACWQADTLWLTENTSTSLISPSIFRDYCMPHLREYGRLVLDAGVIPVHHMCGTLNALLEMIDELPAKVNEAYTTRPLGDVSLAEGRSRMPSKCLIGGTNATLWMQPAEEIVRTVSEDLAACPDCRKIFLTSAGVLPAGVSLEKARTVMDAFRELPV